VTCEASAAVCPDRMEAVVFGFADYAVSLQSQTTSTRGSKPGYAVVPGRRETKLVAGRT
jgi:hypothetical protein